METRAGGLTAQTDGVECRLRNRQVGFRFDLASGALRSLVRTGGLLLIGLFRRFRSGARATVAYFAPERFEGDIAGRSRKQTVRPAGRGFGFVVFE